MTNLISNIIPLAEGSGGGGGGGGGDSSSLTGPAFTYTSGNLTRIDYDGGEYKTLTYTNGQLTQVLFVDGSTTVTKTLSYNSDGTLSSITQT